MSQYPKYQLDDCSPSKDKTQITLPQLSCICCLQNKSRLVSLKNCKHTKFLYNFSIPNIKIEEKVVCRRCHSTLKKIQEFNLQVQESFKMLNNKTNNITEMKSSRLKIEKTVDILINQEDTQTDLPITLIEKEMVKKDERRLRNIQAALDIIESNNSMPLIELLNGVETMKHDILGTTASDTLGVQNLGTTQSANVFLKNTSHQVGDSPGKSKHPNPIRKVKLTKRQLLRERYILSTSKQYLKYPYKCNNCIQGFNFKENLEDHIVRKHATLGKICEICMQVLPKNIDVHMRRHFCRYVCICHKMFVSRDEAVYHYSRQHMRHKCSICGYRAKNLKKMKVHKVKRHTFLCKQCGVVFVTPRRLHWHDIARHKTPNAEGSQDTPIAQGQIIK